MDIRHAWYLVGAGGDCQLASGLVVAQPSPARSLDGDGGGAQLFLHGLDRPEVAVDGLEEGCGGLPGVLLRAQVLPENRVVDVTAPVEFQGPVQADDGAGVICKKVTG